MNRSPTRFQVPGYQVMEYLGKGARSTIWRVRDRSGKRTFALKRVIKQLGDDDRYFQQAINEFEIARRFDHPTIRKCLRLRRLRRMLKVYELHLFMEMCEGRTCQANRPDDIHEVIRIFHTVAEAVHHMHVRGYLHGDVKPNNIIVAPDGTVKLVDFGHSCPIGTVKERIQGTPDFIAPEQVHCRPLDRRTDAFNFGAALYWTLTGLAIPTMLPKTTNGLQLRDDLRVTPPEQHNPQVTQPLSHLVTDCIEMNPRRRPDSMKEIAGRLDLIAHSMDRSERANAAEEPQADAPSTDPSEEARE